LRRSGETHRQHRTSPLLLVWHFPAISCDSSSIPCCRWRTSLRLDELPYSREGRRCVTCRQSRSLSVCPAREVRHRCCSTSRPCWTRRS
jgi:hypothetical protein